MSEILPFQMEAAKSLGRNCTAMEIPSSFASGSLQGCFCVQVETWLESG